jgi:hypothetical protein
VRTDGHASDTHSFVTDFSKPNYKGLRLGGRGTPRFHAGGSSKPQVHITPSTPASPTALPILGGFIIDAIASHSSLLPNATEPSLIVSAASLTTLYTTFDALRAARPTAYPTEPFPSAFARTIILDNADRATHSAFGLSPRRNNDAVQLYFALTALSTFTADGRVFAPDAEVAALVGRRTLGLKTFDHEETWWYHFPARPEARVEGREAVEIQGPLVPQLKSYLQVVSVVLSNRAVFITEMGYIGLGPPGLECGDVVFVPVGAETPFVLRLGGLGDGPKGVSIANGKEMPVFQLVGECYAHGWMDGEALGERDDCQATDVLLM